MNITKQQVRADYAYRIRRKRLYFRFATDCGVGWKWKRIAI